MIRSADEQAAFERKLREYGEAFAETLRLSARIAKLEEELIALGATADELDSA